MSSITEQSEFGPVKYNQAKMGTHYTDLEHCRWISRFLDFPEDEVCCLEPSIGNAEAVLTVTGKNLAERENIKIFGVELNKDMCDEVCEKPGVSLCLKADFLNDVIISQNSFSFAFMNPPYGMKEDGERYETAFLKKVVPYLTKEAVMVLVVPQYVAADDDFAREWCREFETMHLYRFHDREYEKYRQVVLFGRKRGNADPQDEAEKLQNQLKEENLQPLPENYSGERMRILKSSEKGIEEFMNRKFDEKEAGRVVEKSPLQEMVMEKLFVQPYIVDNLGRPPIIPSEGQMYLLAVSGAGQGLVGKEENKDLHLQRGVSKITKRSEYMTDENGNMKEVEISYPQINFNLIEADGRIRTLQ